jgi:hypothetical protein
MAARDLHQVQAEPHADLIIRGIRSDSGGSAARACLDLAALLRTPDADRKALIAAMTAEKLGRTGRA